MKKTYLYVGLILALAAIGWMAYEASGKTGGATTGDQSLSQDTSSGSLAALLRQPTSQECKFDSAESTGTAFIASGRMRGDFTSEFAGVKQTGHIIAKDDTAYVWVDGQAQGFMMKGTASASADNSLPLDLNDKVEYSCKAWKVDESKFVQPANVKFMDYSHLMQDLQANPTSFDIKQLGL